MTHSFLQFFELSNFAFGGSCCKVQMFKNRRRKVPQKNDFCWISACPGCLCMVALFCCNLTCLTRIEDVKCRKKMISTAWTIFGQYLHNFETFLKHFDSVSIPVVIMFSTNTSSVPILILMYSVPILVPRVSA